MLKEDGHVQIDAKHSDTQRLSTRPCTTFKLKMYSAVSVCLHLDSYDRTSVMHAIHGSLPAICPLARSHIDREPAFGASISDSTGE